MTVPSLTLSDLASFTEEDLLPLFHKLLDKQRKVFHFDPTVYEWTLTDSMDQKVTGFALTEPLAIFSAVACLIASGVGTRQTSYGFSEVHVKVDPVVDLPEDLNPSDFIPTNPEEI